MHQALLIKVITKAILEGFLLSTNIKILVFVLSVKELIHLTSLKFGYLIEKIFLTETSLLVLHEF